MGVTLRYTRLAVASLLSFKIAENVKISIVGVFDFFLNFASLLRFKIAENFGIGKFSISENICNLVGARVGSTSVKSGYRNQILFGLRVTHSISLTNPMPS